MASVTPVIPPHILMQKRSEAAGHDSGPSGRATTSAFSDYLFGPMASGGAHQSGGARASMPLSNAKGAQSSK